MNAYHLFPYLLNVVVHILFHECWNVNVFFPVSIIYLYNISELYLLGYISVKYYFMSLNVYH